LGQGDTQNRSVPTIIEGDVWMDRGTGKTFTFSKEKVVFVSSSPNSNAVVTDKSEIWVWGSKYPLVWTGDNKQYSERGVSSSPKTYETSHKHGKSLCRCMF
jgi:alpha-tubulin suppressor-like RCC1 family protein